MTAEPFDQQTTVAGGPGYFDLPMYADAQQVITCWRPTPEELETLNSGGVVWVSQLYSPRALGAVIPMNVTALSPFEDSTRE